MLRSLGIYGADEIEDAVIAALVTGDPVLLVGPHGTAKTMMCRRIAKALGLKFICYDASKAMFEDILGFPNPRDLSKGRVSYACTPISIWDKEFVLIDEVSRASPSTQSKWLELIRSRQVMGLRVPNLRYVFGAMNPPDGYIGANLLDEAFAGRFAWVIPVPELKDMGEDDVREVIRTVSEDDCPMIRRRGDFSNTDIGRIIERARGLYELIESNYGDRITDYVAHLSLSLSRGNVYVDGRRAGMIRRNIISILSVRGAKHGRKVFPPSELESGAWDALRFSLPHKVTGREVSDHAIKAAHHHASKALYGEVPDQASLLLMSDPVEAVSAYLSHLPRMDPIQQHDFLTALDEAYLQSDDPSKFARGFAALRLLVQEIQRGLKLPADISRRACEKYSQFVLDQFGGDEFGAGAWEVVASASRKLLARASAGKIRSIPVGRWRGSLHTFPKDYVRRVYRELRSVLK